MAELTAQTTFTIQEPPEIYQETVDLVLLPENAGSLALRELRYPGDTLPPLIYGQNPDKWENFDTAPLTARPFLKGEMTLADYSLARWPGYLKDRPVREIWSGSDKESRMEAYFFRRLWEYFANPPVAGFITWNPKDRIDKAYNIEIESLIAGGQDTVTLDYLAIREGLITGEVVFTFRIIGEA
ncbi:MAG: hypothetical protein PHU44_00165 [Syntrophales bacterium]|nr:hypothetical protein [Syntrophales bacterium]MDD5640115.1 hypothetical protein [Syntrophales bacterium]